MTKHPADLAAHHFTVDDIARPGGQGLAWAASRHYANTSARDALEAFWTQQRQTREATAATTTAATAPTTPDTPAAPAAAWYPDPDNNTARRYWDGNTWGPPLPGGDAA